MTMLSQRSFAGGELSPAIAEVRVDTAKYGSGAKTIRNLYVKRDGGLENRGGFRFVCEAGDSSNAVRLIPFYFVNGVCVLEFGHEYMRVIEGDSRELVFDSLTLTITAISTASQAVFTYTGTDPNNGEEFHFYGIVGAIGQYLNCRNFILSDVDGTANTFKLKYIGTSTYVNSTAMGAYSSGGTAKRIYELLETADISPDSLPTSTIVATLSYAQDGQVMLFASQSLAPTRLTSGGVTSWSLATIARAPIQDYPANTHTDTIAGTANKWVITAINDETGEESINSAEATTNNAAYPRTISWDAVSGASTFNIYKKVNGTYGYVGSSTGTDFVDDDITPDFSIQPPVEFDPFVSYWPATVGMFQQRALWGGTSATPNGVWAARVRSYGNFTINIPPRDDSSYSFTLTSGKTIQVVRHLLDIGALIPLASNGAFEVAGDGAGVVKAGYTNPVKQSSHGASSLSPLDVGGEAIYVQDSGNRVRSLSFEFESDGFRSNDLSLFSSHLFEGHEIVSWCYQEEPHSLVWAVRDDGVLLCLTFMKEQQIIAWTKHDLADALAEDIVSIPNPDTGLNDVYLVVLRTVNGTAKRQILVLTDRRIPTDADIVDCEIMDCSMVYDGRNTGSRTMTLSGGSTWVYTEELTITSSTSFFSSADVGSAIHFPASDGSVIRVAITSYTNATVVKGYADKTVPSELRTTATTSWSKAISEVSGVYNFSTEPSGQDYYFKGLWHLEGCEVSVLGDGFVVASPNNPDYDVLTVTNGKITLDRPYSVIHVGIPITADLQTLDIDTANGQPLVDKQKLVNYVRVSVEKSRGLWVGPKPPSDDDDDPLENLSETHPSSDGQDNDAPPELKTEKLKVPIKNEWKSNGRVFMRQIDPLPLTILGVFPEVQVAGGR